MGRTVINQYININQYIIPEHISIIILIKTLYLYLVIIIYYAFYNEKSLF